MNIEDTRKAYQELSAKSSELSRTLNFSAIAIIWVFKQQTETTISIPHDLMLPALFVVISLSSDLLQYVSATICWGIFGRIKEIKCTNIDDQFEAPAFINWSAIIFFYLKLLFVAMAYIFLAVYIIDVFK